MESCEGKYGRAIRPSWKDGLTQPYDKAYKVLFWPAATGVIVDLGYDVDGLVAHEFGHTVGLYHEHARWEQVGIQGTEGHRCLTTVSGNWRAVTPPDPYSIMGYALCDDIILKTVPEFSGGDRQGMRSLYTIPRTGPIHFNLDTAEDLLWIRPGQTEQEVWLGGTDGGGNIVFDRQSISLQSPADPNVRPIPIHLSSSSPLTHVFLYMPGGIDNEVLLAPSPGDENPLVEAVFPGGALDQQERAAVPVVGRFVDGGGEDIWWVLPGADTPERGDDMWSINPTDRKSVV